MKAGRVWVADIFEIRVDLEADYTRSDAAFGLAARGIDESLYAPDSITINRGIYLACRTAIGGSGPISVTEHKYRLNIPDIPYDVTVVGGATWKSPMNTHIEIDDLAIYVMAAQKWRLKWSELRWYIEGGLQATIAGTKTFNGIAGTLAPAAVPLIGISPGLACLAGVDRSLEI